MRNTQFVFKLLKTFGKLRVEDSVITGFGGLDKAEHGEYAYVLTPHRDGTVAEPPNTDRTSLTPPGTQSKLPTIKNPAYDGFGFN